jgi:hypothetical protein
MAYDKLRGRLALDYRAMCGLSGSTMGEIIPFRNDTDAAAGRRASGDDGAHGLVATYDVTLHVPTLIGPGPTAKSTRLRYSLPGAQYPRAEPIVTVLSRPIPWTPHFHPSTGRVCLGPETWRAGTILLAHLVIHCARLLNFDEAEHPRGYEGWNGAAVRYWQDTLGSGPLTPELPYPVPPLEVTHGIAEARPVMARPGDVSGGFRPAASASVQDVGFRPVKAGGFRPVANGGGS